MNSLRVTPSVTIPLSELEFRFSTSGGPGGQHANKVATRVDLSWDVARSSALGPRQRERVLQKLARRIDSDGVLRLSSDRFRSQMRNRDDAVRRLKELVADALRVQRKRVPTKPSGAATERRLRAKRHRGELKRARRPVSDD